MAEVINGGVPTGLSVLSEWNYNNVIIIPNVDYGNVFQIYPSGFLNQFKYISGTVSNVNVTITYSNTDDITINGKFVLFNKDDNNTNIALMFEHTGNSFETLSFQTQVDVNDIKQIAFELNNNSTKNMYIAGISIDCGISSGTSGNIDTSDYMQQAIMFGTDANKPALR